MVRPRAQKPADERFFEKLESEVTFGIVFSHLPAAVHLLGLCTHCSWSAMAMHG